jgi:anthranilate phosphoribosyltransferase
LLGKLAAGQHLSRDEMAQLVDAMFSATMSEQEIALALTALREKGETADEILGAATVMRQRMTRIASRHEAFIDTCGTGGDRSGTFNISTAAAIVTAAAGLPVAKHGNRSFSSKTGSADVLRELGVNVEAPLAVVERCLDELGLCFCFAPLWHPSMKQVAAVRGKLGFPTIFNLLGPLVNPAGAPFQLVGVGRAEVRPMIAAALAALGTRRALVVHGADGLDELTISGATHVAEARTDARRDFAWTPADFGLAPGSLDALRVDGPQQSAAIIREVLAGKSGAAREIVVLNSAAALWTAERYDELPKAAAAAAAAIDTGAARELLARLSAMSAG